MMIPENETRTIQVNTLLPLTEGRMGRHAYIEEVVRPTAEQLAQHIVAQLKPALVRYIDQSLDEDDQAHGKINVEMNYTLKATMEHTLHEPEKNSEKPPVAPVSFPVIPGKLA